MGSVGSWSELWKAPVWSRLAGEHLTQERNHSSAEQVWRGPGSSAAARPQHQGCAWPDPPSHLLAPAGLRTESPTAGRTSGAEGIQQEVLRRAGKLCPSRGSSMPAWGAECRDGADNTTFGNPRLDAGLSQPPPHGCALQAGPQGTQKPPPPTHLRVLAAALAGAGAHGQSVPCPVSHGAGRHRAPAALTVFPWEKRPRLSGCNRAGATCSCPGW